MKCAEETLHYFLHVVVYSPSSPSSFTLGLLDLVLTPLFFWVQLSVLHSSKSSRTRTDFVSVIETLTEVHLLELSYGWSILIYITLLSQTSFMYVLINGFCLYLCFCCRRLLVFCFTRSLFLLMSITWRT